MRYYAMTNVSRRKRNTKLLIRARLMRAGDTIEYDGYWLHTKREFAMFTGYIIYILLIELPPSFARDRHGQAYFLMKY